MLPADTGYEDSVTFSLTYTDGLPGGTIWQFTRVGRAIIALSTRGEYSGGTLRVACGGAAHRDHPHLTPAMCEYTDAGC